MLRWLRVQRHVLAPIGGAVALLIVAVGVGAGPMIGIIVGVLIWAAMELMLTPPRLIPRNFGDLLGVNAAQMRAELDQAATSLREIEDVAHALRTEDARAPIERILETARGLIDEAIADPKTFRVSRKALRRYLPQIEAITKQLLQLQGRGKAGEAAIAKSIRTLEQTATVFQRYGEELVERDALDLDVRLSVLAAEVRSEAAFDKIHQHGQEKSS